MNSKRPAAFTLVELLVVITVIAVLIGLLLPGLSHARYTATFVQCGSNIRGVGQSATIYANDYRSWFPTRKVVKDSAGQAFIIQLQGASYPLGGDDRPMFKDYFDIDHAFTCPFSPLGGTSRDKTTATVQIGAAYELYFGYRVLNTRVSSMLKVDDVITYGTDKFNILAADMDYSYSAPARKSAHPDKLGILKPRLLNNGISYESSYYTTTTNVRGGMDRNFVYNDGSVRPLYNLGTSAALEPRLKALPQYPAAVSDVTFLPPMK
jgi:prepilin-type N-terminal cleavage/methylation domain-containing protein